jgi:gliding motility-associated lipoprotein GldH
MYKVLPSLIIILLLTSCNSNTTFKEYKKFDDISWNRFDILEFFVPVQKKEPLDFYLALRHHTNFPYSYIDVTITLNTPDGEMRSRDYRFRLKDTDLKWKGSGMGDLWDIELPIRKEMLFNKNGICKIQIENKMHKVETPGIIEVGLIAKKSSPK